MILIFYSAKGDLGFAKVAKQASTSRIAAGALVVHLQIGAKIARLAQKVEKLANPRTWPLEKSGATTSTRVEW